MQKKYSKPFKPQALKQDIIANYQSYAGQMKKRSQAYAPKANVVVDQCYICDSKDLSAPILKVYGFDYVQCNQCSHVFTTKRLNQETLSKFFEESTDYASTYTDIKQIKARMKMVAKPKIDWAMKFVPEVKNGRWLDVGCAIGDAVYYVDRKENWSATGVEISKDSVETGKKLLKVDLHQQLFKEYLHRHPDEKFDVISFFGYLELIGDPLVEIKLAVERLKPGGVIVLGEANADSVSTMVQQSYPQFSRRHLIPPVVIQQFTPTSAQKMFDLVGLKPIAFWDFGMDMYELIGTLCLVDGHFQKTPMYDFLMNNLNDFQKVVDKKEKGDNFLMIGKKT